VRPSGTPHDADCGARVGFATADTVISGGSIVSLVYAESQDSSQNPRALVPGLLLASAVVFGISAAAGFSSSSQCRHAARSGNQDTHWTQVDEAYRQDDLASQQFAQRGPFAGWGFAFGMPEWQARSVCASSGYRVTAEADGFSCSGVPGRGPAPGVTVRVWMVGGRMGSAELVARSDNGSARLWVGVFNLYHHELERLWRKPADVEVAQPDECRKADALLGCLRSGKAYRREIWRWQDGRRLVLSLGTRQGEGLAIRALYDSGLGAR